jgi:hypothetical protein
MEIILFYGAHGDGSEGGLLLIFLLIFITGNFYYSWKRRGKISIESGSERIDKTYWKQRIVSLIAVLIALFLPVIKTLIAENRFGVISGNHKGTVFDAYSSQVFLILILFFLKPFLISTIVMLFKKEFPIRVFNVLVSICVIFVSLINIVISFHLR